MAVFPCRFFCHHAAVVSACWRYEEGRDHYEAPGDDDPVWERHSGRDGQRGPEWGPGDGPRASEFYRSLAGNARLIFRTD